MADEETPIRVSERRPVTMPLLVLLAIVSATATTIYAYDVLKQSDKEQSAAVAANSKRIDDHEARLRTVEAAAQRMDANLQQIRDWMQEDRQRRGATVRAP